MLGNPEGLDPAQSLPGSSNNRVMAEQQQPSSSTTAISNSNGFDPAEKYSYQQGGGASSPDGDSGPLGPRLQIVFDNLSVTHKKKMVIENGCGLIKSGELTAVVSCCGARGDYYLLNALAGHLDAGGTILANGTPVSSDKYTRVAALIDDDLTSLGELTVRQNVLFSAELRVADYTTNQRRVDTVIEALGLDDVANRELRRCSPFVHRRVSVAKELVLSPEFVFVDSAIEGLPTHEAKKLLEMLRALAIEQNIIVVTSLVQPRYTFLEMVDKVLLLEGTHVVYCGPVDDLITTAAAGAALAGGGHNNSSSSPSSSPGTVVPEAVLNNLYRTATAPDASLQTLFMNHPNNLLAMEEGTVMMGQAARGELFLTDTKGTRSDPYAVAKFGFLAKYSLLGIKNNALTYLAYTMAPLFVAILLAAIYTSQAGQVGMQNRIGIVFFLISGTFLHNMLFVDSKRKEYSSYQRHRAQGYYGPLTYLSFLVITSALIRFCSAFLFTLVVYSLSVSGSGTWDLNSLRDLVSIVALTSFSSNVLVWFVCCTVPSTRIAHFFLFAVYAFNTILAGIILNVNTLPKPFQVMSFGSLIRLGYESALVTQFTNQTFGCVPLDNGAGDNATSTSYSNDGVQASGSGPAGGHRLLRDFVQQAIDSTTTISGDISSSASSTSSSSSHGGDSNNNDRPPWWHGGPNGGHYSTQSCYTGDQYMHFLGFSNNRRWSNLEVMAVIAALGVIGSYVMMSLRRSTSK